MAAKPNLLEQYPAVRKWAEQYYAAMGWKLPDTAAAGSEGVEARRAASSLALGKLRIGAEFLPDIRRAFDGGCKALRNAIASATEEAQFDAIDQQIQALVNDVADQKLVAQARGAGRQALDAALVKFAALQERLDEGGYVFLQKAVNAAAQAHDKAATEPTFQAATKLAVDFLLLADAGEAHGRVLENWTAAALSFIAIEYPAGADRDGAEARRLAVRAASVAKARAGDFAAAAVELDAFPGDAKAADFGKAKAFNSALAAFAAQHEKLCEEVTGSELEGAKAHAGDARSARTLGLKNKRYDEAVAKIDALTAWCLPRLDLARKLKSFDPGMNKQKAFRDAKAAANAEQQAGRFVQALAALAALDADPAIMKENASRVMDKRMLQRKEALAARLPPGSAKLGKQFSDVWDAHAAAVKAGQFDTAAAQAAKLESFFELEAILELKAQADALLALHPAAKAQLDYLASYKALGKAGDYAGARKAIVAALPLLRDRAVYLDTVAEVEAVRDALPAAPATLREDLGKALFAADAQAKARDPGGAAAGLRALLDGTDYFGVAAAIADWKAKDAAVGKRHHQAVKFLADLPAAVKALDNDLAEARKPAQERAAFADSFLALARHETALVQAMEFATVRKQVLGIRDGVLRAAKANPDILLPAPKTEADLKAAIDAAESLAVDGKFTQARWAFEKVRGGCDDLSRKSAAHFEKADAVGSNAGHSLDRHGPDVSLPDLIKRLQTGIPPNAKTPDERSFTGASSKFKSPQDWLAGREVSAAAAQARGIDLAATSLAPPFADQKTGVAFTVEHGKAIDEAFVGKKKNLKFDADKNEFVPDKTYESFEALTGLTRAYVNWIWEFEVLKDVPVEGAPGTFEDVKARDVDEYIAGYKRKHGGADPPAIGGRWVMMQQFPVVDGWDETLQAYTSDPKDLIP